MTKQEIIDKVNDIYQRFFDYYPDACSPVGVSLACRYLVELHYEMLKLEGEGK